MPPDYLDDKRKIEWISLNFIYTYPHFIFFLDNRGAALHPPASKLKLILPRRLLLLENPSSGIQMLSMSLCYRVDWNPCSIFAEVFWQPISDGTDMIIMTAMRATNTQMFVQNENQYHLAYEGHS